MNRNIELAARALCLAAGKDPDGCAKSEKKTEYGGLAGYREYEACTMREWEKYTREAKAVLMAVGLSIFHDVRPDTQFPNLEVEA